MEGDTYDTGRVSYFYNSYFLWFPGDASASTSSGIRSFVLNGMDNYNFQIGHRYRITFDLLATYALVTSVLENENIASSSILLENIKVTSPDSSQVWSLSAGANTVVYDCTSTGSFSCSFYESVICAWASANKPARFSCTYEAGFSNIRIVDVSERSEKEILEEIERVDKEQLEQQKEQTETQKGIFASIKEFFAGFFQNLIDSVIGLFVPSSEEMSGLLDELNQFFSDTFGFLYAPFDYLIQLIGVFTSSTGTTGLTFPGFSIMGHEVWPEQTYDIASDPVAGQVLGYVRMGTGVLLAVWFIMYLQDFFKQRFGGDG